MTRQEPIEFYGAPASPYTRKMLAILRYRHIPHRVLWRNGQGVPEGYPKPKVMLLPTFFLNNKDGELEAVTDSTPLTRRLEQMYPDRSIIPDDPVLSFVNYLVEDFADEWLTKAMMHYRWSFQADIKNAGQYLVYMGMPTISRSDAEQFAQAFSNRQIGRLDIIGSNETTKTTIEESFARLISILDTVIKQSRFIFGARPSSADFAVFGQLTQLAIVDPTPASKVRDLSMRVRSWVDTTEDLSGLKPTGDDWLTSENYEAVLRPILDEIGRVYAPFLLANGKAIAAGEKIMETEIDGRLWTQPAFPYQAKCLRWIQEEYTALSNLDRTRVDSLLSGTGCEKLVSNNTE